MQYLIELLSSFFGSFWPVQIVDPWERGVRVRLGKHVKEVGPGMVWCWPFLDSLETINVLPQVAELPTVSVRTLDGKTFAIRGGIEYRIAVAADIWLKVQDHDESLINVAQGLVANYVGDQPADQLTNTSIERGIKRKLRAKAKLWGIEVSRIYVTDLTEARAYRILNDGNQLAL